MFFIVFDSLLHVSFAVADDDSVRSPNFHNLLQRTKRINLRSVKIIYQKKKKAYLPTHSL
jgi:hypothetical protein